MACDLLKTTRTRFCWLLLSIDFKNTYYRRGFSSDIGMLQIRDFAVAKSHSHRASFHADLKAEFANLDPRSWSFVSMKGAKLPSLGHIASLPNKLNEGTAPFVALLVFVLFSLFNIVLQLPTEPRLRRVLILWSRRLSISFDRNRWTPPPVNMTCSRTSKTMSLR